MAKKGQQRHRAEEWIVANLMGQWKLHRSVCWNIAVTSEWMLLATTPPHPGLQRGRTLAQDRPRAGGGGLAKKQAESMEPVKLRAQYWGPRDSHRDTAGRQAPLLPFPPLPSPAGLLVGSTGPKPGLNYSDGAGGGGWGVERGLCLTSSAELSMPAGHKMLPGKEFFPSEETDQIR